MPKNPLIIEKPKSKKLKKARKPKIKKLKLGDKVVKAAIAEAVKNLGKKF